MIAYPTLLRTPDLAPTVDLNDMATWPETNYLPLEPRGYAVTQLGEVWTVSSSECDGSVPRACPVELVECPVPFRALCCDNHAG